jgi:hypothetical protein
MEIGNSKVLPEVQAARVARMTPDFRKAFLGKCCTARAGAAVHLEQKNMLAGPPVAWSVRDAGRLRQSNPTNQQPTRAASRHRGYG